MTIKAETPYGSLEFPDGTSQDVIQRTVKGVIAQHRGGSSPTGPGGQISQPSQPASTSGGFDPSGYETRSLRTQDGRNVNARVPRGSNPQQALQYAQQTGQLTPESFLHGIGSFGAGLAQGVAGLGEGAGTLVSKGVQAFGGPDLSQYVPGPVSRGAEALQERVEPYNFGQIGEMAGSTLPFVLQPELGIGRGAGRLAARAIPRAGPWVERAANIGTRSVLPSALQPHDPNDPDFWNNQLLQTIFGTAVGEGLHTTGNVLRWPARALGRREDAAILAESDRLRRVGMYDWANDLRAEDYQKALDAHTDELKRMMAEHDLKVKDFQNTMRMHENLDKTENINWMRRALTTVGLGDRTPTEPGDKALNTTRDLIAGKLEQANRQLAFNPDGSALPDGTNAIGFIQGQNPSLLSDSSRAYWNNLVNTKLLPPIAERAAPARPSGLILPPEMQAAPAAPEGGWNPKPTLRGSEFSRYVTMINQEADNLARNAKFPGNNTSDMLAMADALHRISDMVEEGAQGPAEALRLRDQAREGYRIYSTLGRSADPARQSVARATDVVHELTNRAGNAERYRAQGEAGHPDVVHAQRWLHQAAQPPPAEPKFTPPKAPEEPKPIPIPKELQTPVKAGRGEIHPAVEPVAHVLGRLGRRVMIPPTVTHAAVRALARGARRPSAIAEKVGKGFQKAARPSAALAAYGLESAEE